MKAQVAYVAVLASVLTLCACGQIKQYETPQQQLNETLRTHTGGTILEIEKEESLPNAFGGADIYGGRRPTGATELKYLGLEDGGKIKLRVVSTDIETNENWRRRLDRDGYATSSSDAVDFAHDPEKPFEMEGYAVQFLDVESSSVTYRILERTAGGE